MTTKRKLAGLLLATVAAAAVIAGCGGGGGGGYSFPVVSGGGTNTPTQPDASDKFISYLKDLLNQLVDTSEPADVAQFDPPPTSDHTEAIGTQ